MLKTRGYAAYSAGTPLKVFDFERRELGDWDVLIQIEFVGVCHSDIHQARDEWGGSTFPMVPGHEIVGKVAGIGNGVTRFKVGDLAGVGCFVDSCRECSNCKKGNEQFCQKGVTTTYNSFERDGKTPTYGGYSSQIVTTEDFVLKISPKLSLHRVAPLLCAGITTYSPLRHWKIGKGHKLGVVGLGGLGHMAVKLGASMGAEVTVFSTSESKKKDATKLGAHHFISTKNPSAFESVAGQFDFIIDTVSAPHDLNAYLGALKSDGVMILLGAPPKPAEVSGFSLIMGRKSLAGSLVGGVKETQEMLDYCAEHNIMSDIELIKIQDVNAAYDRVLKGDVHYRFVIDMKSL